MTVEEAYQKYYRVFFSYALLRCRFNRERAEDLVQEAFLRVLEWLYKDPNRKLIEGKEITLIIGAIHTAAIDRSRTAEYQVVSRSYSVEDGVEIWDKAHLGLDLEKMWKALENIDPLGNNFPIFQDFMKGFSYEKLAKKYKLNINTVKGKIHKTRQYALRSRTLREMVAGLVIIFLLAVGCGCPKPVDCQECPPVYDTVYVQPDPTEVCPACLLAFEEYTTHYWDSISMLAITEVDSYRTEAFYQVDTMRANFLTWRNAEILALQNWKDSNLLRLQAWEDSLNDEWERLLVYKDETVSMIIAADSLHPVRVTAGFDTLYKRTYMTAGVP
jgi:DNA-directed RNA polymerase specialized sigma24 family protein